jgi:FdhD protein
MYLSYQGIKQEKGDSIVVHDELVMESPFSIAINAEPWTVTMQTPGAEKVLAAGLLLTEGITKHLKPQDLDWVWGKKEEGNEVVLNINIQNRQDALSNRRSLMSIASCGICGKTSFELPEGSLLNSSKMELDFSLLWSSFQKSQKLFAKSGGSHAAALANDQNEMITIFEDIGRHNAVDKCIGDLWLKGKLDEAKILLVSGRISYEIISKCFMARIPAIAAVSAPSSMAVDFAKEWGIQLWGFCREGRQTQYA